MKRRWSLVHLLVVGYVLLAGAARADVFDVAADFATNSNPNGVWSYGYAPNLGGSLILYNDNLFGTDSVIGWFYNISSGTPAVFCNRSTNTVTLGTPRLAPHQAGFHPGPADQFSVYRFTAPVAGAYNLQAAFAGVDTVGTSTDVHVLFNDQSIFDGLVQGFGPGTGPGFATNLVLQANDRIDFEVGYGANNSYYYDSTAIQATLTGPLGPAIELAGDNVILSWPTNLTGVILQTTTNLDPPASWGGASPKPAMANGQYFVTNHVSGTARFYRLRP